NFCGGWGLRNIKVLHLKILYRKNGPGENRLRDSLNDDRVVSRDYERLRNWISFHVTQIACRDFLWFLTVIVNYLQRHLFEFRIICDFGECYFIDPKSITAFK